MVGNSSAGIWEAPSLGVAVVNVGSRQQGRVRAANVIDCAANAAAIMGAIRRAQEPDFVRSLNGMVNPYGDGQSAARVADILANCSIGPEVVAKGFVDR
jgi:UDP-N-acetylglucosamine 2-epimerase (non-hydrolysing)